MNDRKARMNRLAIIGAARLTNWDAEVLAELVEEGTIVEFVE